MDPFTRTKLLSQVPSSKATLPMPKPKLQTYTLSVQRRETGGAGRWREIASWLVTTTEIDQFGPLNCGLRENYRIVISPASDTSQQLAAPNPNSQGFNHDSASAPVATPAATPSAAADHPC